MSLSLLPTNAVLINQVAVTVYGVAPGATLQANFEAHAKDNGIDATLNLLLDSAGLGSDANFNAIVLANLGLASDAVSVAYMESSVAANGRLATMKAAFDFLGSVAGQDNQYGTAGTAFNSKVTKSIEYSSVATNTSASTDAVSATAIATGSTVTLTTSAETLTGTGADDVFNSVIAATQGATGSTLNAGDSITGAGGTDTLNIAQSGDAGGANSIEAVRTTGIEKVLVSNFETDAAGGGNSNTVTTVTASLMSGVTTMGLSSSSAEGDTKFNDVRNLVDAEMRNGAGDLEIAYNSSVTSGTADSQNLTVSGATAGTFTANGVETINVTTETSKSTLTDITGNAVTKMTFAGDQNLTVSTALTEKTLDASAMTGALTIELGAATHTVTGGAGNDLINAGTTLSSADTVTGGAGTDTLALSLGAAVSVGTADSKGALYNVSGFERIEVNSTADAAAVSLKDTSGVQTVTASDNVRTVTMVGQNNSDGAKTFTYVLNGTTDTFTADITGNATAENIALAAALATDINAKSAFSAVSDGTSLVTITADSGELVNIVVTDTADAQFTEETGFKDVSFTNATDQSVDIFAADKVTVTLADASGTADVLNINLKQAAADKAIADTVTDVDVTEVETVNLSATGMKAGVAKTLSNLSGDAKLTTVNISGDSDLVITDIATGNTKLATITSTSTGDITLSNAVATLAQTITTGAGNDKVVFAGNLTADDVVDLGGNTAETDGTAGKDTVTASGNIGTVSVPAALKLAKKVD